METVGTYYDTLVTEASNLWSSTTDSFVPTPYPLESSTTTESSFLGEIPTVFVDSSPETLLLSSGHTTYMSNESFALLDDDGYCLTGYGRFLKYLDRFWEYIFRIPYKIMVAIWVFFFNHFFPIIKKTECDVSVNRPGIIKSIFNFALKSFYIVDKNSLEKVTATIKCIEIPTDKRDYWNATISVSCVVFMVIFIVSIDRSGLNAIDWVPVRRDLTPSPILGPNPDLMAQDEPEPAAPEQDAPEQDVSEENVPRRQERPDANGLGDLGPDLNPLIG